jgi:hypothetical protein
METTQTKLFQRKEILDKKRPKKTTIQEQKNNLYPNTLKRIPLP